MYVCARRRLKWHVCMSARLGWLCAEKRQNKSSSVEMSHFPTAQTFAFRHSTKASNQLPRNVNPTSLVDPAGISKDAATTHYRHRQTHSIDMSISTCQHAFIHPFNSTTLTGHSTLTNPCDDVIPWSCGLIQDPPTTHTQPSGMRPDSLVVLPACQ